MLTPNTKTVAEAGQLVAAATAKQQSGDLPAALDQFTKASGLLKSELQRLDIESRTQQLPIDTAQKQFVEQYVAQLQAQVDALSKVVGQQEEQRLLAEREELRKNRTQEQRKREEKQKELAAALAVPPPSSAVDNDKKKPAASATPPPVPAPAAVGKNNNGGGGGAGGGSIANHGKSPAPLPPSNINTSDLDRFIAGRPAAAAPNPKLAGTKLIAGGALRTSNFAARASDIVYRAIEHATKLAATGQYKAAADVVQHAYVVGTREDHAPKNIEKLPILAKDLRVKFLSKFPPRPPQDNPRSEEENDVLRRSGMTQRLLLFEWDSVEDGYPFENVWMPGRSNAPFEDEFVPKMAPGQMKEKPKYVRFPDMVALHDKLLGIGPQQQQQKRQQQQSQQEQQQQQQSEKSDEEQLAAALDAETKPATETEGAGAEQNKDDDGAAAAAASTPAKSDPEPTHLCLVHSTPDPMAIKQTVVSDCSLVCSLIVTANYERRFPGSRLIRSAIFPQNDQGEPIVNPKGKYCIKMLLNGTTRVVAVDDRFPVSNYYSTPEEEEKEKGASNNKRTGSEPQPLCSHTTNKGEMWVSLMEKAFIKVCGGSYDFPGSNSSNDLYRLSGWLPDIVRFPNHGQKYGAVVDTMISDGASTLSDVSDKPFDSELQWRRLSTCHGRGAVVITIATPAELPKMVEDKLKLIPGHAYAVLDFKQTSPANGSFQLVKVKNPWSSQPWAGLFGIEDARRSTPEMLAELNWSSEESDKGVFWMTWQDVVKFFAAAHLSWNTFSLFPPASPQQRYAKPTRLAHHAHDKSTTSGYCESHQFQILVPPSQLCMTGNSRRMHLVLSRHVLDDSEYEENNYLDNRQQQQQQRGTSNKQKAPFITCHVYDTTHLPSLSAQLAAASGGGGGGGGTSLWQARLGAAGGRRLKSRAETELCPCLHRGVYTNSATATYSFDLPSGPKELCVIVSRLAHDKKSAAAQQLSHEDCVPFPFSLTLYTNLPYTAALHRASASSGSTNRGSSSSSSSSINVASSAVHFSPMPPLKAQLQYRTVVPAEWKSGQSCGGPVGQQTFTYNPQFHFSLSQDAHIQAEILSPIECPINLVICRLKDSESTITNEETCPWAIRVDSVHSGNHPLVLCGSFSCRYGSAADSSLADCIAIGDKGRAPPVVPLSSHEASAAAAAAQHQVNTTTIPASPSSTSPTISFNQRLGQLTLAVRVPSPAGGAAAMQLAFSAPLFEHPALIHAMRSAPLSTWLAPLLLANNFLASDIFSKAVCFGQQLDWSAVTKPAMLQHAIDQFAERQQKEFVFVVVLGTEELPRTSELSAIEKNIAPIATNMIQIIEKAGAGEATTFDSQAAALNDAIERQVLALDACPSVRTDEIRKTRSTLVRAFQTLHSLLEFVSKFPPPNPASAAASSPTTTTTPTTRTTAAEKNPLRTTQTIPAGRYVIVAAAQEKGTPGPFSIAVECEEEPLELRQIPAEGTGWRALPNVTAAWVGSAAAGRPAPQGADDGWVTYRKNPTVQLVVPKSSGANSSSSIPILLFCRLLSLPPVGSNISATETDIPGAPAMQLMLFKNSVVPDNIVASSGSFSSSGAALKRALNAGSNSNNNSSAVQHGVTLEPGMTYYIVMATFDGKKDNGWRCALKMFLFGDDRGAIVSKLMPTSE